MDEEIHIDGLTPKQVKMLDTMWSIGSSEEFDDWYSNLSGEELAMADELKTILMYAVMDAMMEKEKQELTDVKNYLKKFQL